MADCKLTEGCVFFNDKMRVSMPSMTNLMKDKYCRKDFENCARYQIVEQAGREYVPANLFPNQNEKVAEIVANAKK